MAPHLLTMVMGSGRRCGVRILGLDIGTVRIGVALSDELLITAQAFETIRRRDTDTDIKAIAGIIDANGVEEVVAGLPINMNGTSGPKAKEVTDFVNSMSKVIKVPVKMWDERLTTMQAERAMLEADLSRAKRRKNIDRLAAQMILQSYLDSRKR